MTAITASALVGMCGELFAFSEDKPYLFFNRLGESDYVFLFNLEPLSIVINYYEFCVAKKRSDCFLIFNFQVMKGDMEILKNIGQQRMPNGYQQFFDSLSISEGDFLGGFVVGKESITNFIQFLDNL